MSAVTIFGGDSSGGTSPIDPTSIIDDTTPLTVRVYSSKHTQDLLDLKADKTDTYTKTEVDNKISSISTGGTTDLSNYYTKPEVDAKIPNMTSYALKTDIPAIQDLSPYIKTVTADSKYALITSLSSYALKTDIPVAQDLSPYIKTVTADSKYALKTDITAPQDLSPYIKTVDADNKYALKTSLPDMTNYYNKSEVDTKLAGVSSGGSVDLSNYYTKTEVNTSIANKANIGDSYTKTESDAKYALITSLPVMTSYALKTDLSSYRQTAVKITEADLDSALDTKINTGVDLSGYYTKVQSDGKYALITSLPVMTNYALKTDLPTMTNYYSKTETDGKYALITSIPNMSLYALKTDLPTISNYYTKTESDGKYALIASLPVMTNYYTKTEVDGKIPSLTGYLTQTAGDARYRLGSTLIVKTDLNSALITELKDHTQLNNLNGDTNNLHISTTDKTKYDNYNATITSLLSRVTALENAASSSSAPTITNSSLNGQTTVDYTTLTQITFPITGSGPLTVADTSKITVSPDIKSGTPTISGGNIIIPVTSAQALTSYTVTIGIGAVANNGKTNTAAVTCTFTTKPNATKWSFDFSLATAQNTIDLSKNASWISTGRTLTSYDVYGANLDGLNPTVQVHFLGYGTAMDVIMPREGFEAQITTGDAGNYKSFTFDDSTGGQIIAFTNSGVSTGHFRIQQL